MGAVKEHYHDEIEKQMRRFEKITFTVSIAEAKDIVKALNKQFATSKNNRIMKLALWINDEVNTLESENEEIDRFEQATSNKQPA